MGHGTSDQFKHYLYNGYDTEVYGDSGTWSVRIPDGDGDRDLCICETYYFKKVRKVDDGKKKKTENRIPVLSDAAGESDPCSVRE